jgi:hypothetical protein
LDRRFARLAWIQLEEWNLHCPYFGKFYKCKHLIGIAARNKLCSIPSRAKDEALGQKPIRGRPTLLKRSALLRELNFLLVTFLFYTHIFISANLYFLLLIELEKNTVNKFFFEYWSIYICLLINLF